MIRIGYIGNAYPDKRCIINKIKKDAKYKKVQNKDMIRNLHRCLKKIGLTNKNKKEFYFENKNLDVDIVHTFNYICCTNIPWITTFETVLPRTSELLQFHHECSNYKITKNVRRGIDLIANENCKKIIALSNCNKIIQQKFLENFDIDIQNKINNKLITIHPPQKLILDEQELEIKLNKDKEKIRFLFIGNDFFRKGGGQILKILKKFHDKYTNKVYLTIISKFNPDRKFTNTDSKDVNKVLEFLEKNKEWIEWYKNIENEQVLKIIKRCDIGLLPTIQDTYGYSVLEMQAAGVPVISTDIRALLEINSNNCGWICKIPKNNFRRRVI